MCVCLSLHPLGWAHSFWRFLGPQLGLLFFKFELKPTGKDSIIMSIDQVKMKSIQRSGNVQSMNWRSNLLNN